MFTTANKNDNTEKSDVCCSANQAGRKVREFLDTATHDACDATAAVEKQIRSNPVQSSLMAAGVGFLLGALFCRR